MFFFAIRHRQIEIEFEKNANKGEKHSLSLSPSFSFPFLLPQSGRQLFDKPSGRDSHRILRFARSPSDEPSPAVGSFTQTKHPRYIWYIRYIGMPPSSVRHKPVHGFTVDTRICIHREDWNREQRGESNSSNQQTQPHSE